MISSVLRQELLVSHIVMACQASFCRLFLISQDSFINFAFSCQVQSTLTTVNCHDADLTHTSVNGSSEELENKQITEIVNDLVISAEASISGSDNEASKADSSKHLGEKGHGRTSSTVKKPQSFKSVSVNKTFLQSKGTANPISRPESAGSPSSTPQPAVASSASRLKLVAKSGSNLGGSTKTLSTNGKSASGPDPTTVWNKNRAPPPPEPPKNLSDEQLKDRGIHMADRLGPEDLKGQSNWADIEDDEEWAPQDITWTDGTKITLSQADERSSNPPPAQRPTQPPPIKEKPKSPTPSPGVTVSPSIKPGVLASGKGLVLKGAPEKPTLVAKPPAPPTPVKSPWATLPPVEKASPVVMEIHGQPQAPRYPLRDASNTKTVTTTNPAKEIAADDFSRSAWRGAPTDIPKELFNSQSGRYEPVAERRGSRNDTNSRPMPVLQRAMHHEQQGPAEPSAAFQTSRNSAQDAPHSRRRGSSNVSGGSGGLAYRVGAKSHDMAQLPDAAVPPNSGPVSYEAVGSPISTRDFSPSTVHSQPRAPSSHTSHVQLPAERPNLVAQPQGPIDNGEPKEDFFLEQKKIMKTRQQAAILRRYEEEQRAEEAKKARIAEKLAAMGPAPERHSKKKEANKESIIKRQGMPASLTARPNSRSDEQSETAPLSSQPAKQEATEKTGTTAGASSIEDEIKTSAVKMNGDMQQPHAGIERARGPPPRPSANLSPQNTSQWSEAPHAHPERFQSWSRGAQPSSRNVWGAPGNDRSLGNGTFNADIGPLPDSQPTTSAGASHRPTPIGPPRPGAQPQARQQAHEQQTGRLAPIGPPRNQNLGGASSWAAFSANPQADDNKRVQELKEQRGSARQEGPGAIADTWKPVALRDGQRAAAGTSKSEISKSHSLASRHAKESVSQAGSGTDRSSGARQAPGSNKTSAPGPASQVRGSSRFFPSSTLDEQGMRQDQLAQDVRTRSPTPPPPTADGHPVYDGDAAKPHVSLPPQRPRVRLPPSLQSSSLQSSVPGPSTQAQRTLPATYAAATAIVSAQSPRASASTSTVSRGVNFGGVIQGPQEIASQETWQNKINTLMRSKTSPASSMPVDSSTIPSLDLHLSDPATVSMPLAPSQVGLTEGTKCTSREMAEECFGEQEMGSLPNVHLPSDVPDAAWHPAIPNWSGIPMKFRVDASVSESFRFTPDYADGQSVYRISTPGMSDTRTVPVPHSHERSRSVPRRGGSNQRGTARRGRVGQRGGRDSSEHSGDIGSRSSRTVSRGGRPFRPRSENWGRQAPSASVTTS
ncbi:hypothetical protein F5Y15DRAFT_198075 [Xylariaceae sp. FL0016]|nr:hypothetical protein F5Y15DRAFT_198075 [Xylariaceae sp. FL0016]